MRAGSIRSAAEAVAAGGLGAFWSVTASGNVLGKDGARDTDVTSSVDLVSSTGWAAGIDACCHLARRTVAEKDQLGFLAAGRISDGVRGGSNAFLAF